MREYGADGGTGIGGEGFADGFWFAAAAADQGESAIAQMGQGARGVAGANAKGILGESAAFDAEGADCMADAADRRLSVFPHGTTHDPWV